MTKLRPLEFSESSDQEQDLIIACMREAGVGGDKLQILEAGCGRRWNLHLGDMKYQITGVDLDKAALELRINTNHDLDVAIHGDLRSVHLNEGQYDIIFNSFVLEHIEGADHVLRNFVSWLRPGGVMVIRIPDPDSVHGFIARVTPHWFHVFYYRYVLGNKNAGRPGYAPYPVFYDKVVSRVGIHEFCADSGLLIVAERGDAYYRSGTGITRRLISVFTLFVSVVSFGMLSGRHINLLYIIKKP